MYSCKEQISVFDPANKPEITVPSGAEVRFYTKDCYHGQIVAEQQDLTKCDFSHGNPCAGPVYIEGACPGDTLKVEVLNVRPVVQGLVRTSGNCGPLAGKTEARTRIFAADGDGVSFQGIPIPFDPMIGTIGCTPLTPIASLQAGDHGGNMDCKLIKKGCTVYFPVYTEGGLFQLGDVHAAMGDGELCGTGIEVPAEVDVRLTVLKKPAPELPVLVSGDKWYFIGHGKDYLSAAQQASLALRREIMKLYGMDETDSYLYMSMQADMEICQGCAPCAVDMVVRCGLPQIEGHMLTDETL